MKPILVLLFLFSISLVKAQEINKSFLDSVCKATYPDIQIDSIRNYVINYVSFDSKDTASLNTRLRKISKDSIARLVYLPFDNRSYSGKKTLLLDLVRQQKQEDIKQLLAEVHNIYCRDYWKFRSGKEMPVLIVDYTVVKETRIKEVLDDLDVNKVYSIMMTMAGMNASLLAEQAKKGTVQIWFKKTE